jgi:phenylacetate-CoA ligase
MTPPDIVSQARRLVADERVPRKEIAALQQRRLEALARHAYDRSPFYRERLGPLHSGVELATLPTLDKATLIERFDDIVCDPRLRRDALAAHLAGPNHQQPYLGDVRVLATSGSSGRSGLFAYDAAGWAGYVAQFLRVTGLTGMPLWEHRELRIGVVAATDGTHASAQVAMTCAGLGLGRPHPLPVTLPLEEIVDGLNRLQPDVLHAYASYAALLADEQHAGRLRIAPRIVTSSSELLTQDMAWRVAAAFGVRPFDFYATSEGLWAAQCPEHAGFHVFEELCIVENVDPEGQPVPDGQPGARLLVTNLFNRAQPLIRYEVPDVVTIDPEPCPCGRSLKRIRAVHGRSADVLCLDGASVHPLQFAALTADPDVREFQVVQQGDHLVLRLVLVDGAPVADTSERLKDHITAALRRIGVSDPHLEVEPCATIDRPAGGKLQLVVADPAAPAASYRRRSRRAVAARV